MSKSTPPNVLVSDTVKLVGIDVNGGPVRIGSPPIHCVIKWCGIEREPPTQARSGARSSNWRATTLAATGTDLGLTMFIQPSKLVCLD